MPNTINTAADKLTNAATAFATFEQLTAACLTGYAPSLRRTNRGQRALGEMLESAGHRVFWG